MKTEKMWIFDRLLEYWKEKTVQEEKRDIAFWREAAGLKKKEEAELREEAEHKGMHFAETGVIEALTREEIKKTFWEEMAENEKESAPEEYLKEAGRKSPKSMEGSAEGVSEKWFGERKAEPEEQEINRFDRRLLTEIPKEERRSESILQAEERGREKQIVYVQGTEGLPKGIRQTEEGAVPAMDIETLMQQITKRLWEEREGCGRRLR